MTFIKRFGIALFLPSRRRLAADAGIALCLVGALHLPMLNYFVVQVSWPVFEANPGFQRTGPDIEWWFFGPKIKSLKAFLLFLLYFMAVCYPLLPRLGYTALRKREEERHQQRVEENDTPEPLYGLDNQ